MQADTNAQSQHYETQVTYQGVAYLIFVIFFTQAKFLENKIYTKIYTVNCQFLALHLKKFTPAKKNLHEPRSWARDKYQVYLYVA